MPVDPAGVTNNANSKLCRVELILARRDLPSPERMRQLAVVVDEFRAAVAGSTADPFRGTR